jgi:hypothetical protein
VIDLHNSSFTFVCYNLLVVYLFWLEKINFMKLQALYAEISA